MWFVNLESLVYFVLEILVNIEGMHVKSLEDYLCIIPYMCHCPERQ